ncbi:MAG: hypothetical protein ACRDD0_03310 [Bacteroidales bacterium]
MRRDVRHIIGLLLVALYLCYHASSSLFIHTHYFYWGTITHSHPYLPFEDAPSHSHTQSQCNWIDQVNHQLLGEINLPAFFCLGLVLLCIYKASLVLRIEKSLYNASSSRAPPVF